MKKNLARTLGTSAAGGTTASGGSGSASGDSGEKRVVVAATSASPRPFTYYDENNELTGHNVELLNAIFDRLPQYELRWEVTDFPSIFTGIDSGR